MKVQENHVGADFNRLINGNMHGLLVVNAYGLLLLLHMTHSSDEPTVGTPECSHVA